MPIDMVDRRRCPAWRQVRHAPRRLDAQLSARSAAASSSAPSSHSANSSPPSRATRSVGRTYAAQQAGDDAAAPRRRHRGRGVSLSGLKLSRSTNISVPGSPSTLQPVDPPRQLLQEGAPVEQPGQRIGARLPRHFALDRLVLQNHAHDRGGRGGQHPLVGVPRPPARLRATAPAPPARRNGSGVGQTSTRRPSDATAWTGSSRRRAPAAPSRSAAPQAAGARRRGAGPRLACRRRACPAPRSPRRRWHGQRFQRRLHHARRQHLLAHPPQDVVEHLAAAQRAGHCRPRGRPAR